jgi:aromatic ring hydroxylase
MVELTRSAIVAAEAGSAMDDGGVWYPDDRPFLCLRGEMPKWMPHVNELLQLIGGGGFMCRGELYERFYLSDSYRMTALAYNLADKTRAVELVEQFLQDGVLQ